MRNVKFPHRRRFLHLAAAGAAALPAVSRVAMAQAYPTRPVRIIVGFPAGGAVDIVARLMSQWLSERLGQQFVVDNRPGAGGSIATEVVVRAPADGYSLLSLGSPNAINATFYEKLNFNFVHDIAPVSGIIREPLFIEVHPSFPAKTVPEFIAYAKAYPGKINMASAGNGTATHVAGELFKSWPASTWFTCPIAAVRLHSRICSVGRCKSSSPRFLCPSNTSRPPSCARWR